MSYDPQEIEANGGEVWAGQGDCEDWPRAPGGNICDHILLYYMILML